MNTNYAGFWLRFVAWFIDVLILGVAKWIIIGPILGAIGIASGMSFTDFQDMDQVDIPALMAAVTAMLGVAWIINTVIEVLYHTFFEASKFQGSLGKMALGIVVCNIEGQPLDFGKALIRNICKFISNLTFLIGYIIAGFTEKQQALHDIIAGTLVVKKQTALTPTTNP